MPGNEFEKQVQQKMSELKFAPSAAVWQEVEKQINERKKRRLPFLWLLLPGVLLVGAAWLYTINTTGKKPSGAQQPAGEAVASQQRVRPEENKTRLVDNSPFTKQEGRTMPVQATADARKKQAAEHSGNPAATSTGGSNFTAHQKTAPASVGGAATVVHKKETAETVASGKKDVTPTDESPFVGKAAAKKIRHQNREKLSSEKKAVAGQKLALPAGVSADAEEQAEKHATAINSGIPEIAPLAVAVPADTVAAGNAITAVTDSGKANDTVTGSATAAKKKPAVQKKKTIQWGISAGAGGSNISQGFSRSLAGAFSGSSVFDAALYRNSSQNNSTPGTVNGGTNMNSSTRPAQLTPGLAWSLGIFISQPLGKGFSLKTGLGYHYYSMGLQVGNQVDSNKAMLEFRNGNTVSYTNRFHFIELPVSVEKQLGKKSRFSLNTGITVSVLAGSNALQYNASSNSYFKDNNYINKVQAGMQAGFNYRLFQKSVLVEIGPQLSYGLSNIFRKELYGSTHLFTAGIHARIFFNRNKR